MKGMYTDWTFLVKFRTHALNATLVASLIGSTNKTKHLICCYWLLHRYLEVVGDLPLPLLSLRDSVAF